MKKEIKEKWLEALRSGEYTQGGGTLRSASDRFCCLGVLCDLAIKEGVGSWVKDKGFSGFPYRYHNGEKIIHTNLLPPDVQRWSGLNSSVGTLGDSASAYKNDSLAQLNDTGRDFNYIADVIEKVF